MKKGNSIHAIAKDLGVSATTISFIVNGKGKENRISNEVIKRVEQYLQQINYRPNIIAQSLRTGKTYLIGMLVEDISDVFFSSIARGVEMGFENSAYRILFMSTKNNDANTSFILDLLKEHNVDAFIIAPSLGTEAEIQEVVQSGKPVVLYDRYFKGLNTCNVMVDNRGGAYMGTMELFNNGFKNVAFVTLKSEQVQMTERLLGYKDALLHGQQSRAMVLELSYDLKVEQSSLQIKNFLKKNENIEAIFFATNYLTVAGLYALKDLNLGISKDRGVVSFDDHAHFGLFNPSITAVAQPVTEIAKAIVQNIKEALDAQRICDPRTVVLPPQLIRRRSSQKSVVSMSK